MRPFESGTAATARPPTAAARARTAITSAGEGLASRRIRRSLHRRGPRSRPRGCLLLVGRVREGGLVAAAPAERVLDSRGARAQLVDVDLCARLVVSGYDARDRLLVGHGLGHPDGHVFADAEPAFARRVIDLDRCLPHPHEPTRLERPRELLERRTA